MASTPLTTSTPEQNGTANGTTIGVFGGEHPEQSKTNTSGTEPPEPFSCYVGPAPTPEEAVCDGVDYCVTIGCDNGKSKQIWNIDKK